ncbi:GntR family transcriptional regulator [Geobacillus genomosp. 3]|uniref:GntR family transcriptional regulator n=1 Tax=Geobacillus genomosp. 3 TaxID=1921421 RepID=S5YWH0_GEOG3|nr:PLP-dependent aminotransferase family protein [Geobacillus genomosp. 3]AGT31054.1 GntR family transcriptional regulator [Geobacillus genomosp. 3]
MKTIIFALNDHSPKYKQIYEKLKSLIERGDIQANEPLPSIRQLAESLNVSRNTTLMAYEQLAAEGYIRAEKRKGYFANEVEPLFIPKTRISARPPARERATPVVVDFRADAVDADHFPIQAWRRISNQVFTAKDCFRYGDPFGELCLRQQIAIYLLESRGVDVEPNAIVIGSSTQQMLLLLGHILKDEFNSIIVEDPGYDGAREAFLFHDFQLETITVSETGFDLSPLETRQSRLIYVTPSHQSPMGVSMPIQQRHRLIQWVNNVNGYIIEDDYDSEFRYTQKPFPALASIDSSRVIYLGNFSKSFLPGIRLSYMVLPPSLLDRYQQCFRLFESTTSILSQLAMAKFMEEGEWVRHIKRMRLVYRRKMEHLTARLRTSFGDMISIIGEQSGLYVLIKVHCDCSEEQLLQRARSYGVNVYPTSRYFVNQQPDRPMIKLGFSGLSLEDIELGVTLLQKAWC